MTENEASEKGATAVLIAAGMILLIGMAALAIDLGAGFSERRSDQTTADVSALAGGIEAAENGGDQAIVQQVLDFARVNLTQTYSDAEWQALWTSCTDPGRVNFELRDGTTLTLDPYPMPSAWGTGDLDCISQANGYLRVQLPDQIADTSFGAVIGSPTLTTQASAVVLIEDADSAGLLPFGIEGGTGAGETCLTSAPNGVVSPPCTGSSGGSFGPINSELFGEFRGAPDCGNPGANELAENIALGIDHFISFWPASAAAAEGVTEGSSYPGGNTVTGYQDVSRDACRLQGGEFTHEFGEEFPVNTLLVDTGFPSGPVEEGLISNETFYGSNSRLQQPCTAPQCTGAANPTRDVVMRRNNAGAETVYTLDNVGPWEFLTGSGPCDGTTYSGLTIEEKVAQFSACLNTGQPDALSPEIENSPRFAFAPRYWHSADSTGSSWQPVKSYDAVFLGGLWFNCDAAGGCSVFMYPDSAASGELCEPSGAGNQCTQLSLDQLSGWVIPNSMLPTSIGGAIPGGSFTPFSPTLYD